MANAKAMLHGDALPHARSPRELYRLQMHP
jgi:hypothetical protein